MPLDTSSKRRSSVGLLTPWQVAPPSPTDTPGVIDVHDRAQIVGTYSGSFLTGAGTLIQAAQIGSSTGQLDLNVGVPFTVATSPGSVTIPWTTHRISTPHLLLAVYNGASPAARMRPDAVTVHPTTFDVTLTFLQAQSGYVVLNGARAVPGIFGNVAVPFALGTSPGSVTIAGTAHRLGTKNLLVAVYTTSVSPPQEMDPGSVTIDATSFDVVVDLLQAASGVIVLNGANSTGPLLNPGTSFTSQTSVTIPGTTHGLGTKNLLVQVYDPATPAAQIDPGSVTIDATSCDVVVTFLQPTSGTVVLNGSVQAFAQALDRVQDAHTLSATSTLSLQGSAVVTQAGQTASSTATLTLSGAASGAHAAQTVSSSGTLPLAGAGTPPQVAATLTSTGALSSSGGAVLTQAPHTVSAPAPCGSGRNTGIAFASQTSVTISAATHGLATAYMLVGVYDEGSPAAVIQPATVTVDATSLEVLLTFLEAQSGTVVLNGASPTMPALRNYAQAFTGQTSLTIAGATHGLGTKHLLVEAYDASSPAVRLDPARVTVDATTLEVVVTFLQAQSGFVVLNGSASTGVSVNPAQAFTSQTSVTMPGTTHGLGTKNLLVQVYDAASPAALLRPASVTVDATSFDVVVTFAQAQSGTLVLNGSAQGAFGDLAHPQDAQMLSAASTLLLQATSLPTHASGVLTSASTVALAATVGVAQAAQTASSTATLTLSGAASGAHAAQTVSSTGIVAVGGVSPLSQAAATVSSAGTLLLAGAGVLLQGSDTVSSTGGAPSMQGSAALPQVAETVSAAGVLALSGTGFLTQPAQSSTATGTVVLGGTASGFQAGQTVGASGTLPLGGAAAVTQTGQPSVSSSALTLSGASAFPQAPQTLTTTGALALAALAALTQAAASVTSAGVLTLSGTAALAESAATLSSTGTLAVRGAGALMQAPETLGASSGVAQGGTAALSQASVTLSATGAVGIAGAGAVPQTGQGLSSAGPLALQGSSGVTVDAQPLAASATLTLTGAAALLQGAQTLQAGTSTLTQGDVSQPQAGQTLGSTGALVTHGDSALTQATQPLTAAGLLALGGTAASVHAVQELLATGLLTLHGIGLGLQAAEALASSSALGVTGAAALVPAGDTMGSAAVLRLHGSQNRVRGVRSRTSVRAVQSRTSVRGRPDLVGVG